MRLLLDTHVAIWSVSETDKLSNVALETIADGRNDVFVSLATLWEIAIKHGLPPRRRLVMSFDRALSYFLQAPYQLLPIGSDHIRGLTRVENLHGDPFDRMLVSQALQETMNFLTYDRKLIGYHPLIITL